MSEPLSPDELASLLDELQEAAPAVALSAIGMDEESADSSDVSDRPAEPGAAKAPREIASYALGDSSHHGAERLTILERMGDKVARSLRDAIEPFSRLRPHTPAPTVEITSFGKWQAELPSFLSLSQYRLRPLKGGMLLVLDPSFIAALVESFYGGSSVAPRARQGHDFTASEEMLLDRLRGKIVGILGEQWNELTPVEPELLAHETSIGHVGFVRPDEPVVIHRFPVKAGAVETEITAIYPLAMLRPIEARLAEVLLEEEDPAANEEWRLKLGAALAHVRLPVRSVLARPEISVAELLALKPGDVIPITLQPNTPLLAGQHRIADGVIGEQDGRAALMIEKVGNA